MGEHIILVITILFLPVIIGQQILYFEKAKSLKRDPSKGIFYAHFKSHRHHRLDVPPITRKALQSQQECAQQCAETTKCFSFNLASVTDLRGRLTCELLRSDIYNKSDKFRADIGFHHFSIKVGQLLKHFYFKRVVL